MLSPLSPFLPPPIPLSLSLPPQRLDLGQCTSLERFTCCTGRRGNAVYAVCGGTADDGGGGTTRLLSCPPAVLLPILLLLLLTPRRPPPPPHLSSSQRASLDLYWSMGY